MTYDDGFDRTVSDWLHGEAGRGAPTYLDDVLVRTTRTRQRPAWSSLERWLPMQSTTRFAPVPRLVWLLVVVGIILAIGATAIFVGSRTPEPVPAPFGPTTHGTVLYSAADGDIYLIPAGTDEPRPLVTGPTADSYPALSPDGTKFVFNRQDASGLTTMMVADADGSDVRALTGPLDGLISMEWSPDSRQLAVVGGIEGTPGLWVVSLEGRPDIVLREQVGTRFGRLEDSMWRPNGHELIFLGGPMDTVPQIGLYLIQTDGTGLRTIVEPTSHGPSQSALSPDGAQVAYSLRGTEDSEIHVVDVETGKDVVVDFDGTAASVGPRWSPDGTRLLFERYDSAGTYRLAVGSADGGPVVEIGPAHTANTGGSEAQFSPDGTRVLAFYNEDGSSWILDPADVASMVRLTDQIASPFSVQRIAP